MSLRNLPKKDKGTLRATVSECDGDSIPIMEIVAYYNDRSPCVSLTLNSATWKGIADQVASALEEARDAGYRHAQEDIRRALGA